MLYNYLKIAWRNLLNQRAFTLLNILGLSVGMSTCLLILQYVRYEWDYDKISPNTPHIWRAFNQTVVDGEVTTQDGNTHSALAPALKADLPEVVDYFRLYNGNKSEVTFFKQNEPIKIAHAWMVDPGFLRMFPQRFIAGNPENCLTEQWKIVLSQSAAERLFPKENALGQTLQIPGGPLSGTYVVEGIVADPPQHTHLKFNVLASYATRYAKGHEDNWGGYWDYSYFQLAPGSDPEKVRRQLEAYSEQHLKSEGIRLAMQPFEEIHLYSNLTYEIEQNGSAQVVFFLGLVALFILAIAFINYVNMTTARALERAKEVGLRKVVGANRRQLVAQFLLEGFLLNGIALLTALGLTQQFLPQFEVLTGRPLAEAQFFDFTFWLMAAGLFASAMVAACAYPALALTRFAPMQVLRGHYSKASDGALLRKGLVMFQFGCSATLIFALLVVSRQLDFLRNYDKGLSLDQIIALKTPEVDWRQDSLNRARMGVFKNDIAQIGGIRSFSTSSVVPGLGISTIAGTSNGVVLANKPNEVRAGTVYFVNTEKSFYETYGIRFLAGQATPRDLERGGDRHLILNKAAIDMLGFSSPEAAVGAEIAWQRSTDGYRMRIDAVVSNFHIESLKEPARPTFYYCQNDVGNGYVSVKIHANQTQSVLASLEQAWKKTFPESPFEYWFLSEHFARQYKAETQLSTVFGLFAALAVFIACLGLFGLAAHTAERRTKEIGIRKVLGASVAGITGLLAKDFLKLVLAAIVLASPLAYWFMQKWLSDFAYRIDIEWWMFAAAGVVAVTIAFLTVSFQSMKAALANPVKSLRSE